MRFLSAIVHVLSRSGGGGDGGGDRGFFAFTDHPINGVHLPNSNATMTELQIVHCCCFVGGDGRRGLCGHNFGKNYGDPMHAVNPMAKERPNLFANLLLLALVGSRSLQSC